jgi:hypothetical protein
MLRDLSEYAAQSVPMCWILHIEIGERGDVPIGYSLLVPPGPALVALGAGEQKALVFVLAMVAGMGLFERLERHRDTSALTSAPAPVESDA